MAKETYYPVTNSPEEFSLFTDVEVIQALLEELRIRIGLLYNDPENPSSQMMLTVYEALKSELEALYKQLMEGRTTHAAFLGALSLAETMTGLSQEDLFATDVMTDVEGVPTAPAEAAEGISVSDD